MTSQSHKLNAIRVNPDKRPSSNNGAAIEIFTINEIEPLGDQFGADPKKTVPDKLHGALFDELLETYAILDAAKVPNLPELLEASGLEYKCLFKGKAYKDLSEVAPWVVKLDKNAEFTRRLFTKGDAPWHMWDKDPGIYIRSHVSLGDLCAHFRKFTRLRDDAENKWYYFAFYKYEAFESFVRHYSPEVYEKFSKDIYSFIVTRAKDNIAKCYMRSVDADRLNKGAAI